MWLLMFHAVEILFSFGFCCILTEFLLSCFGFLASGMIGRGVWFWFLEHFQLPVKFCNCFRKMPCESVHAKHSVETSGSALF